MLTRGAKKEVVGYLPGGFSEKIAHFYEQGEPLLHKDLKPIQYYSAMLRDLDSGHVFDVDLGSGTLCIDCMMANIGYTGVAHNEAHLNFVDQVLDRCMLALLSNEKTRSRRLARRARTNDVAAVFRLHDCGGHAVHRHMHSSFRSQGIRCRCSC